MEIDMCAKTNDWTFYNSLYTLIKVLARKVMYQLISTGCTLAFFFFLLFVPVPPFS